MKTDPQDLMYPTTQILDGEVIEGVWGGLTKREYFAAMAMQGVCASHNAVTANEVAKWSVKAADALIEALNKQEVAA
jgi:hypothetical protein